MRLIDVFQKEDYKPLDRGIGFMQFYENGDKFVPFNPMDWNYRFWNFLQTECSSYYPSDDDTYMLISGGEL